jgi:hypothetical protein
MPASRYQESLQAAYSVAQKFVASRSSKNEKEGDSSGLDGTRLIPFERAEKASQSWHWDDRTALFEMRLNENSERRGAHFRTTRQNISAAK